MAAIGNVWLISCLGLIAVINTGCTSSAEDCTYTASCGSVVIDAGGTGGSSGRVGTVAVCHGCTADSDCASGTRANSVRCVPMTFKGSPHGNYCMTRSSVGSCSQPYTTAFSAASVSGAASETYCGIDQSVTTCEAVVDFASLKSCTRANNCGAGLGDGLCQNLGTGTTQALRCTIPCTANAECLQGQTCSSITNGYCR